MPLVLEANVMGGGRFLVPGAGRVGAGCVGEGVGGGWETSRARALKFRFFRIGVAMMSFLGDNSMNISKNV